MFCGFNQLKAFGCQLDSMRMHEIPDNASLLSVIQTCVTTPLG